jgi:hypothetical protein
MDAFRQGRRGAPDDRPRTRWNRTLATRRSPRQNGGEHAVRALRGDRSRSRGRHRPRGGQRALRWRRRHDEPRRGGDRPRRFEPPCDRPARAGPPRDGDLRARVILDARLPVRESRWGREDARRLLRRQEGEAHVPRHGRPHRDVRGGLRPVADLLRTAPRDLLAGEPRPDGRSAQRPVQVRDLRGERRAGASRPRVARSDREDTRSTRSRAGESSPPSSAPSTRA